MNYENINTSPTKYKTIWLNTSQGAVVSTNRTLFTFNDLPLIQIRGKSILKINSITLSGAGVGSAPNHNWDIKLHNVKYNTTSYFNSDNNSAPTIACLNYDTNNSIQNGTFALELVEQDIKQIVLQIESDDGHGAIKNQAPIEFHICLTIEEYS
jgi:hypothetical protein